MREAVLPLRFELFLTQTVLGLPQTVHRIGMRIVKQPLADHEVPDHHHYRGYQLADIRPYFFFFVLLIFLIIFFLFFY